MIIAITGTPGTGKTSVCKALKRGYLDLNAVIEQQGFFSGVDPQRGSLIADLDKLQEYVRNRDQTVVVIESHLAHLLKPEVAIVLRANPAVLAERLARKGFSAQKIQENVEAETLDIILAEAVELCDTVYEIDTTGKNVEALAAVVREIVDVETEKENGSGRKRALRSQYQPGVVNWAAYIEQVCLARHNA